MIAALAFWTMTLPAPYGHLSAQDVPDAQEPKPATSPGSWVSNNDYPVAAIRGNEQGTVGFTLDVDDHGATTACTVTASSGYKVLDDTTCQLMLRRASFVPARDAKGKPMAARWASRFRWEMPGRDSPVNLSSLPQSAGFEVLLTLDVTGKVTDCKLIRHAQQPDGICQGFLSGERELASPVRVNGQPTPVKRRLTIFSTYEAVDAQ